eukprot:2848463-Rhodomonas_salina.1
MYSPIRVSESSGVWTTTWSSATLSGNGCSVEAMSNRNLSSLLVVDSIQTRLTPDAMSSSGMPLSAIVSILPPVPRAMLADGGLIESTRGPRKLNSTEDSSGTTSPLTTISRLERQALPPGAGGLSKTRSHATCPVGSESWMSLLDTATSFTRVSNPPAHVKFTVTASIVAADRLVRRAPFLVRAPVYSITVREVVVPPSEPPLKGKKELILTSGYSM